MGKIDIPSKYVVQNLNDAERWIRNVKVKLRRKWTIKETIYHVSKLHLFGAHFTILSPIGSQNGQETFRN